MPHRSSASMNWRNRQSRYLLIGNICTSCKNVSFPGVHICKKCGSDKMSNIRFSGKGIVETFTTIRAAPSNFENTTPYIVAIVKLEEGPTITAQITNTKNVKIGSSVIAVFRKLYEDGPNGLINYGFKFECID